jgi:hypothetical protein
MSWQIRVSKNRCTISAVTRLWMSSSRMAWVPPYLPMARQVPVRPTQSLAKAYRAAIRSQRPIGRSSDLCRVRRRESYQESLTSSSIQRQMERSSLFSASLRSTMTKFMTSWRFRAVSQSTHLHLASTTRVLTKTRKTATSQEKASKSERKRMEISSSPISRKSLSAPDKSHTFGWRRDYRIDRFPPQLKISPPLEVIQYSRLSTVTPSFRMDISGQASLGLWTWQAVKSTVELMETKRSRFRSSNQSTRVSPLLASASQPSVNHKGGTSHLGRAS